MSILEQIRVKRCPGRRSGCRLGDSAQYVVLSSSTLALATEAPICAAAAILRASRKGKDAGLARPGLMGPRKLIVKGSLAGLLGQGSSAWQKAPSWHYSRLFAQLCRPNLAPAVMPAAVGAARASGTRMLVRHGFRFRTTSQTTGGREMTLWSIQRVWPAERKLACTKQASSSSLLSC